MSSLYESFLKSLPSNRSDMINDLEIPDDISVSPATWTDYEEVSLKSDSFCSESIQLDFDARTIGSDSSLALSRAMTDSEIDYGRYKRLKNRKHSDPWDEMHSALSKLPPTYLSSLHSFQTTSSTSSEADSLEMSRRSPYLSEEFKETVERFFEDECSAFESDDEGILELKNALANIEMVDFADCGAKY